MNSRMPNIYQSGGGPLNWQDEQTGVLPRAVMAYFAHGSGKGTALSRDQLTLVIDYCRYYIHAPCWDANPHHNAETRATLAQLRQGITTVETENQLLTWIYCCLDEGIDPL